MKPSFIIVSLCSKSKILYNRSNYLIRRSLNNSNLLPSAFELMDFLRYSPQYEALPKHSSQQIIKSAVDNWKSYFAALGEYQTDPQKFKGQPKPPRYKQKQHILYFTKYQVKLQNGYLHFPKIVGLSIKTRLSDNLPLHMVRILPQGIGYIVEIVYFIKVNDPIDGNRQIMAIDLGVNNLIASTNNIGKKPIIIKGGIVKSINQYFNKEKARLQSIYDKQNIKTGPKLEKLEHKRYWQINYWMHKASRIIINWALKYGIDTLVVGYNPGWKQEVSLGKRNNQNFVSIPFYQLLHNFSYKCEDNGIHFLKTEENYTSKTSFVDNEEIGKQETYLGKRVERGLFVTKTGLLVNADVNGSGNIGRKVFPVVFHYGIVDAVVHPLRLELSATRAY